MFKVIKEIIREIRNNNYNKKINKEEEGYKGRENTQSK